MFVIFLKSIFLNKNRAFTLIELLVVVAIIGTLSSVALLIFSDTRTKSRDTAIKAQMREMQSQAEIFAGVYGSYLGAGGGGVEDTVLECLGPNHPNFTSKFASTVFDGSIEHNFAGLANGAVGNRNQTLGHRVFCAAQINSWAFAVPIYHGPGGATGWCVDGAGAAKYVGFDFNNPGSHLLVGGVARCP